MNRFLKLSGCLILAGGLFVQDALYAEGPLQTSAMGLYVSLIGNATGTMGPGVGVLLSWKEKPLVGFTWSLSDKKQTLAAFGDWRVGEGGIEKTPFWYYLGGGVYGGVTLKDGDVDVTVGTRVPLGMNFFPAKQWELFFQLVPMLAVLPELGLHLGVDLGFKYRF